MENRETKKIIIQVPEKTSHSVSDFVLPVWAIIYLILMFILFCKGMLMVINCNSCGGTETLLLSLFS